MNNRKRPFHILLGVVGAFLLATTSQSFSQNAEKIEEELVKFKKGAVEQQKTPQFTVQNVVEKRFKPKDWLEIEFELETVAPKAPAGGQKQNFHDEVTMKYYVYLEPADATKKKTLTLDVNYVSVPVGETIHSVVYLSPTTLVNLTGNNIVDKSMVKFWGVEAYIGGKLVGMKSSTAGAWWKSDKAPTAEPGRLQLKSQTPFAPLWSDYYLEEKKL